MKQEDWTQQLKDRLADHEEPVPADLWADIEAQLPTPRNTAGTSWRRWVAAAAVIGLVGGGLLTMWNHQENGSVATDSHEMQEAFAEATPMNDEAALPPQLHNSTTPQLHNSTTPQLPNSSTPQLHNSTTPQLHNSTTPQKLLADNPAAPNPTLQQQDEAQTSEPTALTVNRDDNPNGSQADSPREVTPTPEVCPPFGATPTPQLHIRKEGTRKSLMATLYSKNTFQDLQQTNPVMMSSLMASKFFSQSDSYASRQRESIRLTNYEEEEHHKQPVTLGLRVGYPLSERLSLSTGIVYSKLQSDFTSTMRMGQIERQQTLHYVGVPLNVEYRLLQWRRFSVYAAAGLQSDWNVKARQFTNGIEVEATKDRCQFSVNGSLGVAYNLLPHVGLYAEPTVSHYFDNKSSVNTYFKERPTNVSLQLGVRLKIEE